MGHGRGIVPKYGVVPKDIYPESISSSASRELDQYLNKILRQDAQILRELIQNGGDVAAKSGTFARNLQLSCHDTWFATTKIQL
jgi:aminopeptidase C